VEAQMTAAPVTTAAQPERPAGHPELTRLPIIVGVTGHRDVRPEDTEALRAAIGAIFEGLLQDYPSTQLLALTPLAVGADRLFADEALARGIPFRVPLPLPLDEYVKDFNETELAEFERLVRCADSAPYLVGFVDDNDAANVSEPARRAKQYALVGAHIVRAAHVVVALWDGKPSDKVGGTADVVDFRLGGVPRDYLSFKPTLLDAPELGAVYHIPTPRAGHNPPAFPPFALRVITHDGELAGPQADPFRTLYARLEEFNEDTKRAKPAAPAGTATENLARLAGELASHYQRATNDTLMEIFVMAFFGAGILAVYGHIATTWHGLIVPYVLLVVVAIFVYRRAKVGRFQDRFLDYRALETGLNVQRVWDLAGLNASVADYYIRRQRSELDWIRVAIRTARNVDKPNLATDDGEGVVAVTQWIADQLAFFRDRSRSNWAQVDFYSRFAESAWRIGVVMAVLFLLVIVTAWLGARGLIPDVVPRGLVSTIHDGVVFVIAMMSVLAALLQDYPKRRAFREHARRYETMAAIYERARLAMEDAEDEPLAQRHRVAQNVILEIGREALLENGDWVLLHRQLQLELVHV
jgi:hypothetical protein